MAKHITPEQDKLIAQAIKEWKDPKKATAKPSWNDVIQIVKVITGDVHKRDGLSKRKVVYAAYSARFDEAKGSKGSGKRHKSKALLEAEERVKKRDEKIEALKKENTVLTEKFVRWSYNASKATRAPLDEEALDKAIRFTETPKPRK